MGDGSCECCRQMLDETMIRVLFPIYDKKLRKWRDLLICRSCFLENDRLAVRFWKCNKREV